MCGLGNTIVAASRAAIAGGHENGDAFGDRLLVGRIVRLIGGSAVYCFTLPVADAHDGRRLAACVEEVLQSDQTAERCCCVGARGNSDSSIRCSSTGPFGVKDGFRIIRRDDSGVGAIVGAT